MNLRCLTAPPGSLSSESCLALKPVTRKFGLNSGPSEVRVGSKADILQRNRHVRFGS
jgi:hypothetical protein